MGKSGTFCPGLRLALTLKRVAAGPKIASFLTKNAHFSVTSSPTGLLTQNGRISKRKPSSPRETRTKIHWLTLHAAAPQGQLKGSVHRMMRAVLFCHALPWEHSPAESLFRKVGVFREKTRILRFLCDSLKREGSHRIEPHSSKWSKNRPGLWYVV